MTESFQLFFVVVLFSPKNNFFLSLSRFLIKTIKHILIVYKVYNLDRLIRLNELEYSNNDMLFLSSMENWINTNP